MDEQDVRHALEQADRIASEAAAAILGGWRMGAAVRKKGAIDLVTDYDLAAEAHIRRSLAAVFPEHRIVAEEGEDQGEGNLVWYVDPLDGTTNFAHGHFMFTVSIALYDGAEGVVGVVVAPALGVTWKAARGLGAHRNGQPCRVSGTATLSEALCATGFPYDKWTNPDHNVAELDAFLTRTQGVRRGGSAALDLAMVADGTFDLYWEDRLSPWDMAAGAVLVREAGGRLSDYDGAPGDPRTGRLVATNAHLHDATLEVLGQVRGR
ncbi:MAG: inositol monophosphatase family protein [Myxococcota bacterium]